jgi:hypothetical protein
LQEQVIGWDPTLVTRTIDASERLYILILFLVVLTAIVRSLRLIWNTLSFSGKNRISQTGLKDERVTPHEWAVSALKNRFDEKSLPGAADHLAHELGAEGSVRIELANIRFRYLWQLCLNDVGALKRSVCLTLLLSAFILMHQLFNVFRSIAAGKAFGLGALYGGLAEICTIASTGLAVSVGCICFRCGLKEGWHCDERVGSTSLTK